MEIDLIKLKNNIEKKITLDEDIDIDKLFLDNTELLDIKNVHVIGELEKDAVDDITLYLKVTGTFVLPCSITLVPVDYNFQFEINDKLENILEEIKNDKKIENTIDILPIIWENILMEIPMKVVSPNAELEKLKGDGWQFVTEQKSNNVNPELEKLKDLL